MVNSSILYDSEKKPMSGENLAVGCYQLYLSSNPKAGLFDHQYLWKESVNILDFLLGDNHQRKEASKTTTFGQVWLVVLLSNQIPGFFGHQYL